MEFNDVVRRRRMIRRYDPARPVPEAVLRRCLENAVRAPSAGFSQGWDFVVLSTAAERDRFWAATTEPGGEPDAWLRGIRSAPALIVCCSHKQAYLDRYAAPDKGWADREEARWPVPYWDIDTGMAALLMLLTAVDEGLGGLFFGVPAGRHDAVHAELGIPDDRTVVGVVAMGYAVSGPRSPSLSRHRRTVEEVSHWGRFGAHQGLDGVPG
ncbi:MAG TPA: nitroreductase family protein [Dermatophilaceae bacterium]|nr:nitroreductase family protein [Dermatophilaceae bacterium]